MSTRWQPSVVCAVGENATGDPLPAQIATAANKDEL
jgi:hypothetical protein